MRKKTLLYRNRAQAFADAKDTARRYDIPVYVFVRRSVDLDSGHFLVSPVKPGHAYAAWRVTPRGDVLTWEVRMTPSRRRPHRNRS